MNYQINFKEVVYSLSEALDYVGIDDLYHGKRVAYMAAECARQLQLDKKEVDELIYLGMLHDCGVSRTSTHIHLVSLFDWNQSKTHAERGYELLKDVTLFESLALPVLYHHTHWQDLVKIDISDKTMFQANLIFLVDRVDALRAQSNLEELDAAEEIKIIIKKHSGTMFSPELVELFLETASNSSFWFYLESNSLEAYLGEWIEEGSNRTFSYVVVKEIAMMFAKIVDAKSPYTAEHSLNVANLSVYLAELAELDQDLLETLELAALLHDLGKLRVTDKILDKSGPLNHDELLAINRHGFDSEMILRKIKSFRKIAELASMHHETLDGKGYPYRRKGEEIPIAARILAIADIFQALVQTRPYRESLSAIETIEIIEKGVLEKKLDSHIVALLRQNLEQAYVVATGNNGNNI